jgi:hypothetical protein
MPRITALLVVFLVALGGAAPASAHRLDEYLQALRVDVRADGVVLELDLTPGANLAGDVVAELDRNGDRAIDPSEADAYVAGVMRSLEVTVDDRPVALVLVRRSMPSIDDVRAGTGLLSMVARADVEQLRGHHRLHVSNGYRADVTAYLANVLRPDSHTITIASQARDPRQQTLTADYLVTASRAATASAWTAFAALLIGCCCWWRRPAASC